MAHEIQTKDEKKEKVHHIRIEKLDDGSFLYEVCGEMSGLPDRYSMQSVDEVKSALEDDLGSPHMKRSSPSKEKLDEAFHELKKDPPRIVEETKSKYGKEKARKQGIAIAFSKARKGRIFG